MSQLNVNTISPQSGSSITVSGNISATSQTGSIGRIEGESINLSGDLTAKRYIVSSSVTELSVITNSGSTAFGDSLDDTHIYTGSLQLTGSITASKFSGDGSGLSNVFEGTAPSASISTRLTNTEVTASSFLDGTATLISGSVTSTGSFGKLQVGSATIQIPSNGFITMGSLEGMVLNTRFGEGAGQNLQTGGTQNTLIGNDAGAQLTTGDKNVVLGQSALSTETGGQNNTAIGYRALKSLNQNSVGGNIALGFGAAEDLATGAFNIVIGYGADTQATDDTRSIVIGCADAVGLGDNTTVIGDSTQTLVAFGGSDTTLTLSGSMEISGSGPATSASLHIRDFSFTGTDISASSTVVAVDGNNGRLFTVSDQMTGSLFSANTVAGLPVIEAFSDNKVTLGPFSSQVIVDSDGNISGSATSTGSFGIIENNTQIAGFRPIINQTANFSASLSNAGRYHIVHGNITCSIGTDSDMPLTTGAEFEFFQSSSVGNFLFETGSGVSLLSKNDNKNIAGQHSGATLKKVAANTFHLVGDLT